MIFKNLKINKYAPNTLLFFCEKIFQMELMMKKIKLKLCHMTQLLCHMTY